MKELDLFNCRNGQQWPCCSCEATEKRKMGLYWGEGKGSEKPPVQTEVHEVLNRNEVSADHWEQICTGEVAAGAGEFCSFSRLNYTKPIATQSQFNTDTWIR